MALTMTCKVLVVDVEPVCVTFLSMALEAEGCSVRTANNAGDAVRIASEFDPDILITEWMLKDNQDGIGIAKALRASRPNLKVIFITGMAIELVEPGARQVSGSMIEIKPVDLDQILAKIRVPGRG